MPGNDGRADNLVPTLSDVNLDEARDLAVQHCPVDVTEFLDKSRDGNSAFPRLKLVQPHVAHLRIGVRAPGHGQRAHPVTAEEEGVANDDSGGCVGHVSELEARSDVSRGEDPPIAGTHPVVDFDAVHLVVLYSSVFEPETSDIRQAARANEDLVYNEIGRLVALSKSQHFLVSAALDTSDRCVSQKLRSITQDRLLHQPRGFFVFSRQNMRTTLD